MSEGGAGDTINKALSETAFLTCIPSILAPKIEPQFSNRLNEFPKSQRLRGNWARAEHAVCGGLGLNHPQSVIRQLQLYSVGKKRLIMGEG